MSTEERGKNRPTVNLLDDIAQELQQAKLIRGIRGARLGLLIMVILIYLLAMFNPFGVFGKWGNWTQLGASWLLVLGNHKLSSIERRANSPACP